MTYAIQWLRSLLFTLSMYVAMPLFGLAYLPWAIANPAGARAACKAYSRYVFWTARWMIGLHVDVRGTIPTYPCLIAAKHQSFLDIMIIFEALPEARFIMKHELRYAPVIGWFALRNGCIPVRRGERGKAIAQMRRDVEKGRDSPGQVVIYPQGTRTAPGSHLPYKGGSAALYHQLGQPCVPVACNVGVLWPKRGIHRTPGVAAVEFLDPIQPGLGRGEFMRALEQAIESRSDTLMAEAGFNRKDTP